MREMEYRDPDNVAFEHDGRWYRIASRRSAEALEVLTSSPVHDRLVARREIPAFERADEAESLRVLDDAERRLARRPPPGAVVHRVETIEVVTYPWEWPDELLRRAALFTLDLRLSLLGIGLDLKDASALNVQFRGTQPFLADLGSIHACTPNPSWTAVRQFVEHFVNPLALSRRGEGLSAADYWSISRRNGITSRAAREVMSARLRMRPGLALLQFSTVGGGRKPPVETALRATTDRERELAMRATVSLTRRLRRQVRSLRYEKRHTTWSDYGARSHYATPELQEKLEMARAFVVERQVERPLVLDVGGNDGMTAEHLGSTCGARTVVIDHDAGALDNLLRRASASDAIGDDVLPLIADLTNLTWDSGVLGGSVQAFIHRVKPDAVLCQAVLHHVIITQGVPIGTAVASLAAFGAPVQIEFATESDPKVRLLISQVPGWSGDYSLDALVEALRHQYETIRIVGSTSTDRVVVEGHGLRTANASSGGAALEDCSA